MPRIAAPRPMSGKCSPAAAGTCSQAGMASRIFSSLRAEEGFRELPTSIVPTPSSVSSSISNEWFCSGLAR